MEEKILKSITNGLYHYLEESFQRTSKDNHEKIKSMFDAHMKIISDYCIERYINKQVLTETFIKGLHKILYPKDYLQYVFDKTGKKVVYMKPGEYKTINNKIYVHLFEKEMDFIKPELVKIKMKKLIDDFNKNICEENNKYDIILYFWLDFGEIHPFGDGNGRVLSILIDLLLIKNNLEPMNMNILKEKDMIGMYKAIELSRKTRDLKYLKDFIKN